MGVRLRGRAFARVFPVPGRAVEEDPLGGLDPQPHRRARVLHRKLDHLPDLLDLGSEASDILVADPRRPALSSFAGFSLISIPVLSPMMTASAAGVIFVATSSIFPLWR